jgi:nucleotide-binding universal stress UspA family protein
MDRQETIRRILVPHDLTPGSDPALGYALRLASWTGARITVFHAYDVPSMGAPEVLVLATDWIQQIGRVAQERVDAIVERCRPASPAIVGEVHEGAPWREIDRVAREKSVDLIVMGTHGRRGLPHALLGSVAEKVVRTAPCPVLVVRGTDAELSAIAS